MAEAEKILIRQACIYDPSQQLDGEICDLYLAGGKISAPFADAEHVIDAAGRVVLAGGIDPYCLVAAPGQPLAHMVADFPSLVEIGEGYARMGYVHLHQPFTTLLTAGLVRRTLAFIPIVDTSTGVVIDLKDMGQNIKAGKPDAFILELKALISLTGALKLFLPFPHLRHRQRHYIQKNLSVKKVLGFLSQLEDPDLLPISLWAVPDLFKQEIPAPDHFHITGLGMALDSEQALEQACLFLASGGSADLGLSDGQPQLMVVPFSDNRPEAHLSLDAGLLSPIHFYAQSLTFDHSLTRAGWSLLERSDPSWPLALGASGPAGGQFGRMPAITAWLARPEARPEGLQKIFNKPGFDFYQLARHTRLEPALSLGLSDIGHLREGAKAHIAIYDIKADTSAGQYHQAMADCWCLIKDGVRVREAGKFTGLVPRSRIVAREMAVDVQSLAQTDLLQNPTLRYEHLRVNR